MAAKREQRDPGAIDWRTARVADMQPCVVCGRPAHLRHPVTNRPHHKVCDPDAQQQETGAA